MTPPPRPRSETTIFAACLALSWAGAAWCLSSLTFEQISSCSERWCNRTVHPTWAITSGIALWVVGAVVCGRFLLTRTSVAAALIVGALAIPPFAFFIGLSPARWPTELTEQR